MKIEHNFVTIVEHLLIRDTDTGEILLNERPKKVKPEQEINNLKDGFKND
jgi:hypothetical protein